MTTLPKFELKLCAACLVELNAATMRSAKAMEKERGAINAGVKIADWKSARRSELIKKNLPSEMQVALDIARSHVDVATKIDALCKLHGVRVPMASAILTAIDPLNYTVIDVRALDTLAVYDYANLAKLYPAYLEFCTKKAKSYGMSLRDFDRGLWKAGSA